MNENVFPLRHINDGKLVAMFGMHAVYHPILSFQYATHHAFVIALGKLSGFENFLALMAQNLVFAFGMVVW
jgi:hypothetical protein